jgi:hypothetical protein
MEMKIQLVASVLVCALAAGLVQARTPPQANAATPIPPGIAAPDQMEARLGTLKVFDGFPDDATVEKL